MTEKTVKRARGFTLIELLVVIAIIGLLSAVVLASLNSARSKGRDTRRVSDARSIAQALELSYDKAKPNEYPDALSTLVTDGFLPRVPTDAGSGSSWGTSGTGQETWYDNLTSADAACGVASGNCQSYVIGVTLENSDSGALDNDIDGTVGSVSCADPVFCIQP